MTDSIRLAMRESSPVTTRLSLTHSTRTLSRVKPWTSEPPRYPRRGRTAALWWETRAPMVTIVEAGLRANCLHSGTVFIKPIRAHNWNATPHCWTSRPKVSLLTIGSRAYRAERTCRQKHNSLTERHPGGSADIGDSLNSPARARPASVHATVSIAVRHRRGGEGFQAVACPVRYRWN